MVVGSRIKADRLPDALLAEGVSSFDAAEAARRTGLARDRVHGALKRLADAGEIFSPARGFYVIIPAQYRSWGAVPASWFVDAMTAHLGRAYYVGLLSAAELLGAAHQRPQVFQVVVDKYLPDRAFGRVRMQFVVNHHVQSLATTSVNTPTGTMRVSTPEVTALDLVSRPLDSGGLDNVVTVLIELHEEHPWPSPGCSTRSRSIRVRRREGWVISSSAIARFVSMGFMRAPGKLVASRHRSIRVDLAAVTSTHGGTCGSTRRSNRTCDPRRLHHRVESCRALAQRRPGRARPRAREAHRRDREPPAAG
jgi:predicted transcriptional regulator of viral defense system